MAVVREPFATQDGSWLTVTASAGVALAHAGSSAEDLLREADSAMYRAKARGGDRVSVVDDALRAVAGRRLHLEAALRRDLAAREVDVHYQPIVDLGSGRTGAVEALLRWTWDGEPVSPAEAIAVAEESGLIVDLGAHVLGLACLEVARWPVPSCGVPLSVSVNLSGRQLAAPGLVATVSRALDAAGLPAHRLTLEITESVLLDDGSGTTLAALEGLRALGVVLAVDDFGTGYSSLAYLKNLPVDVLKIDRAFVGGLGGPAADPLDRAIVAGIVDLAHACGLRTVAEGVETLEQVEVLAGLGCSSAQGYYLGRPAPAAALRRATAGPVLPLLPRQPGPDRHAAAGSSVAQPG